MRVNVTKVGQGHPKLVLHWAYQAAKYEVYI